LRVVVLHVLLLLVGLRRWQRLESRVMLLLLLLLLLWLMR
jgi:hypothetical protein